MATDIWTMQVSRLPEHGAFDAWMGLAPVPKVDTGDGSREIPAPSMPSTMAELRRLGARTQLTFGDEGPRYDFDEVP